MTKILGVHFSNKNKEETVNYIDTVLDIPKINMPVHIITANPETVMMIKKNKEFRKIAQKADLITPDGIGIVLASRLNNGNISERVAGFDMVTSLFEKREESGNMLRVYFLGSDKETMGRAVKTIENRYSSIKVVGYHHGYYPKEKEKKLIKEINECKPDLLLVGLGAPRQDQFIFNNRHNLYTKVAIGVGGTFDVWGGKVLRAPLFMQKMGLEWFWRLITNPKRIFRQLSLVSFVYYVFMEKLGFYKHK